MTIKTKPFNEPLFKARQLHKTYALGEVKIHALRSVDLNLNDKEFVVLLGPSGSGKSTLLNIIGGIDSPSSGELNYKDHQLVGASPEELTRYRREHVGFVFQFYNLVPSLTALENVALATELSQNPLAPEDALAMVGLSERKNHFPAQLSGGEQQRVAIARAVAKRPDILLCDEPTGALDYETAKLVLETLIRVNRELGTLVVIITHNASIAHLAHRVIRLSGGTISSDEVNKEILSPEDIQW